MKSLLDKFYQYQILLFSQSTIQSDWGAPIDPAYTEFSPQFQSETIVDTFYPYATDPSVEPTIAGAAANPSNYQALPYAAAINDPSIASTFPLGFVPANPTNYEDPSYAIAPFELNMNQASVYEAAPEYPRTYQNFPYESASVDPSSYQGPPYWAAAGYSSDYQVISAPYYETLPYGAAPFDPSIFEGSPSDPSIASTVNVAAPAVPSNYEAPPYWSAPFDPSIYQGLPYGYIPADRSIDPKVPASATANPSTGQTLQDAPAPAETDINKTNPATAGVPDANATVPIVAVPS